MTDLNELLERVRSATGPDRHLDALIEVEARRQQAYRAGLNDQQRAYWNATVDGLVYDSATRYDAPRLTASIDAALALVEQVLRPEHPGMTMELRFVWAGRDDRGWCRAEITWPSHEFIGHASSPQLAMIEALLSALISKESQS